MDRKVFYNRVRGSLFGGSMTASQVAGMEHILDALDGQPLRWLAYSLATVHHEVGRTMQPVREGFKETDAAAREYVKRHYWTMKDGKPGYGRPDGPYGQVYYGRGFVQCTWLFNYEKASKVVGLDLVKTPDLALDPVIAAKIMRDGMEKGWFTGRKLADYIPAAVDAIAKENVFARYVSARRVINGQDKAETIANYAMMYEDALTAAGYGAKAPSKPAEVPSSPPQALSSPPQPAPDPKPQIPVVPVGEPAAIPVPPEPGFWSRFWAALTRRMKG